MIDEILDLQWKMIAKTGYVLSEIWIYPTDYLQLVEELKNKYGFAGSLFLETFLGTTLKVTIDTPKGIVTVFGVPFRTRIPEETKDE